MDTGGLKDLTALGLAGLALVVLALTIRVLMFKRGVPEGALVSLQTFVDDLEKRINRKDEDLEDEFARCWREINELRKHKHEHASDATVLRMLVDRVKGLEARERTQEV